MVPLLFPTSDTAIENIFELPAVVEYVVGIFIVTDNTGLIGTFLIITFAPPLFDPCSVERTVADPSVYPLPPPPPLPLVDPPLPPVAPEPPFPPPETVIV